MIRMEVACFLVILFMSIIYFSAKRKKTKLHKIFTALLAVSMLHLVFDGLTVYTVNHLETVPAWINSVLHRVFIGTMILAFYILYRYIRCLIEEEAEPKAQLFDFGNIIMGIAVIGMIWLPIRYVETPEGNYSYGPVAYMTYISIAIYLLLTIRALHKNWSSIHSKKKMAISLAIGIELLVAIYQAIFPLSLISGMGIMLANLAIYLTMENPDIMLVQQIQKEKRKADEANAAKSTFLSHMSHEIRTPMNAVVGMTEILLRTDLSAEQREYLENIKSSGNALVSIINDILDISKIEAGKMELQEDVYELSSILREIHMIIQNRIGDKPVKLLYEIDEELPYRLYGDGLRIRQIFINLLNNAVKFTEKGHVKLKIKAEQKSEEEISLLVSVADTGQGIKKEDLQRLFGAFEQVDVNKNKGKEGTGLGLAISNRLIEMMGGKLEVRSEYGVGSEFFFTICQRVVSEERKKQVEPDLDDMNFTAPGARVLVVDDTEMNLKVAAGLLAPLRMQVDTVSSGEKALIMLQQHKYHIVFMDHMMPVMDGIETTKRLRGMAGEGSYYRDLPVIALTANAMKEAEKLFYEAGMNGFVAKPIDMRQMSMVLRKYLPEELLIHQSTEAVTRNVLSAERLEELGLTSLKGIDINEGIKNSGGIELFVSLLGDFYKLIDAKAAKIEKCIADRALREYTIEVHALKSTARMIGAMELSEYFWRLEQSGRANDMEALEKETPKVLALYRSYKAVLKAYGEPEREKREAEPEEIIMYLQGIEEAVEAFDLDLADEAMERLEECQLPESCQPWMEKLRVFVADVAMEDILHAVKEMLMILKEKK